MSNFTISPSPHIHGGDSIEKNMYGVLIALIPAFIFSIVFFGLGAIVVTLTSVVACLIFEFIIQKYLMKQRPTVWDGSAIITGVLLAFKMCIRDSHAFADMVMPVECPSLSLYKLFSYGFGDIVKQGCPAEP